MTRVKEIYYFQVSDFTFHVFTFQVLLHRICSTGDEWGIIRRHPIAQVAELADALL